MSVLILVCQNVKMVEFTLPVIFYSCEMDLAIVSFSWNEYITQIIKSGSVHSV